MRRWLSGLPTVPRSRRKLHLHQRTSRPSVAFAVSLQNELTAYKERFRQLRICEENERDALLDEPIVADSRGSGRAVPSSQQASNEPPQSAAHSVSHVVDRSEPLDETSVDENGSVCFYGRTSLYHIDAPVSPGDKLESEPSSNGSLTHKSTTLALFMSSLDPSILGQLLDSYWRWPHHLHCVLSKKIFLRASHSDLCPKMLLLTGAGDLYTDGPHASAFLLSTILTQAARWSTRPNADDLGAHFAAKSLQFLLEEVDSGSSISTVQGLLILSARESACGRTSQGWLYSGMAFRMMRDLGMHIPLKRLGPLARQFSDEDLRLRQQVFWACYCWDKTISVCLGRSPMIVDHIDPLEVGGLLDGKDADDEVRMHHATS
ncbi:hypothetical protein NA57DRAFT_50502 [Rhizodiscina lignyota]|uniref:Xylanolytic transcriptional activator regulatory domain-containing protein n=1 Tax=Rhizodiscina lignyota TaxID=1504668 RepID=A0A9P4MFK9_9PEZI|nr:hypothetical protein NA57DRAFT_50502 [Rhizodiscina lignyota]